MHKYYTLVIAATAAVGMLSAQDIQRRASIVRGPGGEGCRVSVMVDGVAEVEIRGDTAILHNISGRPSQFRVFECTSPIPPNAAVRFEAESGRGRQELRAPREGGPVIVHIEDPEGGIGEYRFRLVWGGEAGDRREQGARVGDRDRDGDRDGYTQERERFFQGEGWRRGLFQRVREDVEHLEHSTIPFTGDRARVSRTITELNELQDKLRQGRYDERQLDDAIRALGEVVQENRMSGRDRDVLADDLNRLRDFREHHDDYGARYRPN